MYDQSRLWSHQAERYQAAVLASIASWSAGRVFSCPGLPKHQLERPEQRSRQKKLTLSTCEVCPETYFHTSHEAGGQGALLQVWDAWGLGRWQEVADWWDHCHPRFGAHARCLDFKALLSFSVYSVYSASWVSIVSMPNTELYQTSLEYLDRPGKSAKPRNKRWLKGESEPGCSVHCGEVGEVKSRKQLRS